MAKKRKIRKGRLALVIIACIILVLLLIAGVFSIAKLITSLIEDKQSNSNVPINNNINNQTEDIDDSNVNKDISISLGNYKVYEDDTDKLGFNFVVCELTFESKDAINFNLSKLQTSEKINLGDVSSYLDKLANNKIDVNKLNVVNNVFSDQNTYTCNVFIPYKTDSLTLGLYNLIDTSKININLSKNVSTVTSLKIDDDSQIVIDETRMVISGCYQSDLMVHNDEPYYYPNNIKIYTFTLTVSNVDPDTNKIVSATFVPDDSSETYTAMPEGYRDLSIDNIIGKTLKVNDKYALFFEVFSSDDITNEGKLVIKFENNDRLIELSTALR